MTKTGKRQGRTSVFHDKVIARRSALLTAEGNERVDALRERLGREMGRATLSIGDVFEALVRACGDELTGAKVEAIAAQTNK